VSTVQEGLAGLMFDGDLPDGEFVSDAVLVLRLVHQETGRETFLIRNNDSISFITQRGLMELAMDVITDDTVQDGDDD
jgi:hypothetical protein